MDIKNPVFYFLIFPVLVLSISPLLVKLSPAHWFTEPNRNRKLEGLRGLLAPTVFFHHALITYYFYQTQKWEPTGSTFYDKLGPGPVILFFFMTGFLFWNQALNSSKPYSAGDFLFKRVKRLAPGYLAWFLAIVGLAFLYTDMTLVTDIPTLFYALLSWIFFGLPFGDFKNINDFAHTVLINASIAWSLRFEWLFYFLFGFLRRFSTVKKYLLLMIGLSILKRIGDQKEVLAILELTPLLKNMFVLYKDFFYFLVIGFNFGILSSFLNTEKIRNLMSKPICRACGVLALILYLSLDQIPAYGLIGSSLLFLFFISIVLDTTSRHFLHWKGFQVLGQLSYSVYLIHGIGLFASFHFINTVTAVTGLSMYVFWGLVYLIGVIVLLISHFSYRYIEYPFIRGKNLGV